MIEFKNKVVLITGGGTGIGEAMAYQYAMKGTNVILTGRRLEPLQKVMQKCISLGVKAWCKTVDMEKTETIYWNSIEEHIASATYKMPMRIAAKTGYGFPIMNRVRFTPQVGFAFLKVKSLETTGATVVDGAYAGSLLAGARLSFALTDLLAISASPEYAVPVIESDGYKALSGFVPSWSKGFNVKLGVVVYF